MKNKFLGALIGSFACAMFVLGSGSDASAGKTRVIFGGGPAGGTFQVVANAIQVYKPVKEAADYSVKAQSSAGSVENLRKTDAGKQQMSVVYSGHVWLGRNGKMKNDPKKYENVLAVGWLYGAPAQLVVRKGSGIKGAMRWAITMPLQHSATNSLTRSGCSPPSQAVRSSWLPRPTT